MIFNACVTHPDEGTQFLVISATDIKDALHSIDEKYGTDNDLAINIEHGIEDLVNEQYGGIAVLSTG